MITVLSREETRRTNQLIGEDLVILAYVLEIYIRTDILDTFDPNFKIGSKSSR